MKTNTTFKIQDKTIEYIFTQGFSFVTHLATLKAAESKDRHILETRKLSLREKVLALREREFLLEEKQLEPKR